MELTREKIEEIRAMFKIGSPGQIDALCDLALKALAQQPATTPQPASVGAEAAPTGDGGTNGI